MGCATWLDHEFGYERIVGYVETPTGKLAKVEQRCEHCDKVRRSVKRSERIAYAATEDVARLEVEG